VVVVVVVVVVLVDVVVVRFVVVETCEPEPPPWALTDDESSRPLNTNADAETAAMATTSATPRRIRRVLVDFIRSP
jgi:hypothetical protein